MKQKSIFLTIAVLLGLGIAASAQTPPSYVPTNGLVGWWPFNGNANDESGNGNNGMVNGATLTEDRFGMPNLAYSFNGASNNIVFNPIFLTDLSISIWFKKSNGNVTNPNNGHQPIGSELIGQGTQHQPNVTYSDFAFGISSYGNSAEYFAFEHSNLNDASWTDYQLGFTSGLGAEWNSAIIVIEGTLIKLYINGILSTTENLNNTIDFSGAPLSIGSRYVYQSFTGNDFTNFFKGSIDDIGIWSRSLTQEEIIAIYNSEVCSNDLSISPENITANLGGSALLIANTSDVNPIYTWQTDFGQGFQNVLDYGSYSGASTSTLTMSGLQLMNQNQPIRVITIADECVDTSNVVFISITDTCITNVIDTTYITVTDTLIINLNPTGFNPVTYANTILMYPNPTSEELTINYGDFASLAGYTLKIFNSIGQEIHSANISQQQEVLQLGTWGGAGTYQVVIYNTQGVPVDTRAIVLQ